MSDDLDDALAAAGLTKRDMEPDKPLQPIGVIRIEMDARPVYAAYRRAAGRCEETAEYDPYMRSAARCEVTADDAMLYPVQLTESAVTKLLCVRHLAIAVLMRSSCSQCFNEAFGHASNAEDFLDGLDVTTELEILDRVLLGFAGDLPVLCDYCEYMNDKHRDE